MNNENPDIIKIAALLIKDKKVLIVKAQGREFWSSLGGKVEKGEDHITCLKREVREEIGVDVISQKLYLEAPTIPTDNNDGRTIKNYFYIIETSGDIVLNPNDEIIDYKWVSKEEFESNTLKIGTALQRFAIPKLIEDGIL